MSARAQHVLVRAPHGPWERDAFAPLTPAERDFWDRADRAGIQVCLVDGPEVPFEEAVARIARHAARELHERVRDAAEAVPGGDVAAMMAAALAEVREAFGEEVARGRSTV